MEEKEIEVSRVKRKYARSIGYIGGAKTKERYGKDHFVNMGKRAWASMTDEEKKERIYKMVKARQKNRKKKVENIS